MINELIQNRKPGTVFICPLDWGLGHATRLIPVIRCFLSHGWKVILGGSGKSGSLIHESFPELPYEHFNTYSVKYPGNPRGLILSVLFQVPLLANSVIAEHRQLKPLISKYKIDTIVSDNRYGIYSAITHNIIITHQLSPVLPVYFSWAEYPLYLILKRLVTRFDECWIPDIKDAGNLTGNLSHRFSLPANARFIGWLSRFQSVSLINTPEYDIVVSLSGPQPQLRHFTSRIIAQAKTMQCKILIISGMQDFEDDTLTENVKMVNHLVDPEFLSLLRKAHLVICRSGYSSIMDLIEIQKPAVLVPTPGQPEQEYLAERLSRTGLFSFVLQSQFDLKKLYAGYLKEKTTTIIANPSK
ncbi:MAG TPA: glycosyltransferase [Bacteroidales bacterium]|nr:glycosyltransferase [Bacteroidales bacterium]